MSVTVPSKRLPDAPRKHHGLGEFENCRVDLPGPGVCLVHDVRQTLKGAGDLRGHLLAIGERQCGFADKAIGQAAQRRRGVCVGCTHRGVPRPLALVERCVARVGAAAADRQHECGVLAVVRIELPLAIFEAHWLRPSDAEGFRAVPKPSDCRIVGLGHDPEQAGSVPVHEVRDREIGGERQAAFACSAALTGRNSRLNVPSSCSVTCCCGGSTREAPRASSAASIRRDSSVKPSERSSGRTVA